MLRTKRPSLSVGLALHDPSGAWNDNIRNWKIGSRLSKVFGGKVVVSCSIPTQEENPKVLEMLRKQRVRVMVEEKGKYSNNQVENNYLSALDSVTLLGTRWVMYGDFDRLALDSVLGNGLKKFTPKLHEHLRSSTGDIVTLLRDVRTEYAQRVLTEWPVLRLISETVGVRSDPLGSYMLFKPETAKMIIKETGNYPGLTFPPTKWLIMASEHNLKISNIDTEGVIGSYEDPEIINKKLLEQKADELDRERGDFYRKYHTGSVLVPSPLTVLKDEIRNIDKLAPSDVYRIYRVLDLEPRKSEWTHRVDIATGIVNFVDSNSSKVPTREIDKTRDSLEEVNLRLANENGNDMLSNDFWKWVGERRKEIKNELGMEGVSTPVEQRG